MEDWAQRNWRRAVDGPNEGPVRPGRLLVETSHAAGGEETGVGAGKKRAVQKSSQCQRGHRKHRH